MSEVLQLVAQEVRSCTNCRLHEGTKNGVPGEGNPNAEIVFVGEGPGYHEDNQGRPFVGPAGKLLNEMLERAGRSRRSSRS
jgi:uracil-DNA glycosylase